MTTHLTRGRRILIWAQRILLGAVVLCALIYLGDFLVFTLRGKPMGNVEVSTYMAVPLKNNKTEYYFEGRGPMFCALSLFPQAGSKPCWYLRRHPLYAE